MITKSMTSDTFVICGECGSTIFARDPESLVDMEENAVLLRCRNNCCGHVARYTGVDMMNRLQAQTTDHTTRIFLEG